MKWTTTPPTEPGWYWAFGEGTGHAVEPVQVVRALAGDSRLVAHVAWADSPFELSEFSHFAGPLTAPAAPEPK